MSKTNIYRSTGNILIKPDSFEFEVVERKFRGHPDSLADMVAQRFSQLYIKQTWKLFPELDGKCFPNFSADKVTLSGASTNWITGKYEVLKPVHALLIGKITQTIGDISLEVDSIFSSAIEDIFEKALGHKNAHPHIVRQMYSVSLAGTDHNPAFYNPKSPSDLLKILSQETVANDTVYVVAYAPLSLSEKLAIELDNITDSSEFKSLFPEIGTDIKAMIRRRSSAYDVTLCLPVFPEQIDNITDYQKIIDAATDYLKNKAETFLSENSKGLDKPTVQLWTNTKDTKDKKYFAVWGTALSKGDIGAVGRGNRHQGFISGIRPSTNEAVPGKNPNHFAGIIYQLVGEEIANTIYNKLGISSVIYITANNGDPLDKPNSIDIITDNVTQNQEKKINELVDAALYAISEVKSDFINGDVYKKFMRPKIS